MKICAFSCHNLVIIVSRSPQAPTIINNGEQVSGRWVYIGVHFRIRYYFVVS